MKTEKFKVGDEIRLKKNLKFGNEYGNLKFIKGMKFDGFRTIDGVGINQKHFIIGLYFYTPEMLVFKTSIK